MSERELFLRYVAQTSDSPLLLEISHSNGVYLFDYQGNKYLDLISGISVSNLGHQNPKIIEAIKKQVDKYLHLMVYGEMVQSAQVRLAELLISLLPQSLNCVYFVNSGSEAVEGAMKLAKRYTQRTEIVFFENAYHGCTQGAMSIMGNEEFKQAFRPLLPDVKMLKFNHFCEISQISEKTAAVIVEPIQGEAGVVLPKENFLYELRKRCDKTKTLLIFDEIQTGFGRTGKMFAFENFNVIPDILLIAKALGGGMPLGAFISSSEIMRSLTFNPVLGHITTFGGHPVCCAAGLAALEILTTENILQNIEKKEKLFRKYFSASKKIVNVHGKGLLLSVELIDFQQIKKLISLALQNGILTDWFLFNDKRFRIAPPLIISESEIEFACKTLVEIIDKI